MQPYEFKTRHERHYPKDKAVVPKQLKQGVLNLLGKGPELETCGRFVHDLAAKTAEALRRILGRSSAMDVLVQDVGLPPFRALMVARLLSIVDPSLYDFDHRDLGDYGELGLRVASHGHDA